MSILKPNPESQEAKKRLMNGRIAFAMLLCALENVNGDYFNYGDCLKNKQVERCFAYELYHQWSILLDNYKVNHPNDSKIYLNGEIPKNLQSSTLKDCYPDLVLHSGQDSIDYQFIACEIKRESKNNSDGIIRDFYKLLKYFNLVKKGENGGKASYDISCFIMIGSDLEKMKTTITKALQKISNYKLPKIVKQNNNAKKKNNKLNYEKIYKEVLFDKVNGIKALGNRIYCVFLMPKYKSAIWEKNKIEFTLISEIIKSAKI